MNNDGGGDGTEIVIVRRRTADDGMATKAGAWKIAYADFVTAMMAFFLVMWLINASNEETRAQVASYFNPIKLTDSSTGARSLKDMKDTRNPQNRQTGDTAEGSPPAKKDSQEEAELLANPPKSLDKVAKTVSEADYRNAGLDSTVEISPSLKPDKSNPGVGDPYDPKSWEKAEPLQQAGKAEEAKDQARRAEPAETSQAAGKTGADKTDQAEHGKASADPSEQAARDLVREVAARLGKQPEQLSRMVEVKAEGQGLLVNLTEAADFEMFKTGSAEPEAQLIDLIGAVAGALKGRPGDIFVRGHTDSRPYRSKYYDNWQLSTARAHLARYMLIRGGLPDSRIRRVEGVADREPRNPRDPQAPENRRIEIFIGTGGP